jgi:thioredoxin-like negative regulator of GroEL
MNQALTFVELDVDEMDELATRLNVDGMPTFMAFFNGKHVSNKALGVAPAAEEPEVGTARNVLLNLVNAVHRKISETTVE